MAIAMSTLVGLMSLPDANARNPRGFSIPAANPTGTWYNVTPGTINLNNSFCSGGNYGTETVAADTSNPGTLYTLAHCQGIWKSTDYGQTWNEMSQSGTNGVAAVTGGGGLTVQPNATTGGVPTIYTAFIRNYQQTSIGFWASTDGGANWTTTNLIPPLPSGRGDVYPPIVDPYAPLHLLMAGHEQAYVLESTDGGNTWSAVNLDSGMAAATTGTAYIFFINTGTAGTPGTHSSGGTANTWLWMAQDTPYGTWRTTNGGTNWTQVNTATHSHGSSTIYQPGTAGVIFLPNIYGSCSNSIGTYVTCPSGGPSSGNATGLLYSSDYGQTWPTFLGANTEETVTVATSKNVYTAYGYPIGVGSTSLNFEYAAQPGTGSWSAPSSPTNPSQGPGQIAVVNDGTHNILIGAFHNVGLWRYIEP